MSTDEIDVKQAVQAAAEFVESIYGTEASCGLRLEEVESAEEFWLITLSLIRMEHFSSTFAALAGQPHRDYKVFKIDRTSGEVVSMKIRARPETEQHIAARDTAEASFVRFGLTDAAIERVGEASPLVLTDDLVLSGYLASRDVPVVNFNHLRSPDMLGGFGCM